MTRLMLRAALVLATLVAAEPASAQSLNEALASQLGLSCSSNECIEVRVWVESNERVDRLYRIMKSKEGRVAVERIAFTEVVHPTLNIYSASEAAEQTKIDRQLLEEERCAAAVVESRDYLTCRIALTDSGPWEQLYEDLLPEQLRQLPPKQPDCDSMIVVDGETITIEFREESRRHVSTYSHPDVCCATVACALVSHVRAVVRNIR